MNEDAKYLAKTKASEMDIKTKIAAGIFCALYSRDNSILLNSRILTENAVKMADELIERLASK